MINTKSRSTQSATHGASIHLAVRPEGTPPMHATSLGLISQIRSDTISRRRLLISMSIGLTLGILISLTFFLPLFPISAPQATEMPSPGSLHVMVANSGSKILTATQAELARNATIHSAPEIKSNSDIVNYVSAQAPSIAPREYVYVQSEHRLYQPEIGVQFDKVKHAESNTSTGELFQIPSSGGRFKSAHNDIEWQGAWNFGNPEHNLKLGSDYGHYVNGGFGSLENKLSVVRSDTSKVLENLDLRGAAPTGLSR